MSRLKPKKKKKKCSQSSPRNRFIKCCGLSSNCGADKFFTCKYKSQGLKILFENFQIFLCPFRSGNIELFALDCSDQKMGLRVNCEPCMIPKYGLRVTCFTHLVWQSDCSTHCMLLVETRKSLALWKRLDRCFHSNVLACHLNMIFGLFLKAGCLVYTSIEYWITSNWSLRSWLVE
jgi:hypothetical protein